MTIVFNLFDYSYSAEFLKSWITLTTYLNKTGIRYHISQHVSCNAFYAKQMCLGGNVLSGPTQTPYQQTIKYDILVFLSNKIIFTRQGVFEELEYPWFRPHISTTESEQQFVDIDICRRIKNQNIDLLIDKTVDLRRGDFNFIKINE